MKKLITIGLLLLLCSPVYAVGMDSCNLYRNTSFGFHTMGLETLATANKMALPVNYKLPDGATFIGDFTLGDLEALDAQGNKIFTFTRTTGDVSTYVDSNGVIQLATMTQPRFNKKTYTSTSLIDANGLLIEAAGKNYCIGSYMSVDTGGDGLSDNWTNNSTATLTPTRIDATAGAAKITTIPNAKWQYLSYGSTGANQTCSMRSADITVAAAEVWTASGMFYVESAGRPTYLRIVFHDAAHAETGAATTQLNDGTGFVFYSVTSTAPATTTHGYVDICYTPDLDFGQTVDIYASFITAEKGPYPTSYIPNESTAAGVARNAETLKYAIAGNRTAAQETIAIQFMPLGGDFSNTGVIRTLIDNNTTLSQNSRFIGKRTTSTVFSCSANVNGNSSVFKTGTTIITANTSWIGTGVVQHASPYVQVYVNGLSEGTYTSGDYTTNTFTDYFKVGTADDNQGTAVFQLNGIVQGVHIYNRPLSSGEVLSDKNLFLAS